MRMPWAQQKVENWMSSVKVWKRQPCMPRTIRAETSQPEPEMAQLVPSIIRALFKNFASRRNQVAYAELIQLESKFLELR